MIQKVFCQLKNLQMLLNILIQVLFHLLFIEYFSYFTHVTNSLSIFLFFFFEGGTSIYKQIKAIRLPSLLILIFLQGFNLLRITFITFFN